MQNDNERDHVLNELLFALIRKRSSVRVDESTRLRLGVWGFSADEIAATVARLEDDGRVIVERSTGRAIVLSLPKSTATEGS